jgi:hypothetical protein
MDHVEGVTQRALHDRLAAKVRELGGDPGGSMGMIGKQMKSGTREIASSAAESFAKKLLASLAAQAKAPQDRTEADQKDILSEDEKWLAIVNLDENGLKTVIDALIGANDVDELSRKNAIVLILFLSAKNHPREVLDLFVASSAMGKEMEKESMHLGVLEKALGALAEQDPGSAVDWVLTHAADYPEAYNYGTQLDLIGSVSQSDPEMAFGLIEKLGCPGPDDAVRYIARATKTPAQCAAMLGAMREYAAAAEPSRQAEIVKIGLNTVGSGLAAQGFDQAMTWIGPASLGPEEKVALADGIDTKGNPQDTAKWLGWMEQNLPRDKAGERTEAVISQWAREDFKAAGDWINQTPGGPVRDAAVGSYAETLSEHEPEAAARWAETLPHGQARDKALQSVYREWSMKDPAAARDFALSHGLRPGQ